MVPSQLPSPSDTPHESSAPMQAVLNALFPEEKIARLRAIVPETLVQVARKERKALEELATVDRAIIGSC